MNSNKSLYEDLWEKGWLEELGEPGPSYRSRMRLLMRRIRNLSVETGARILDIGCGNGNLLILASCLIPKPRLFGVDISQNAVEVARKRLPEGRFAECDLAKEPIPFDEKFDLILCSEVLEHIGEPSLVLEKVYAILKPGASFVLSVPAGKDKWGPHDKAVGHLHRFERDEM
ncbi:MAG: class I SAM-dependent DNA methyltransferase, partial [Candidatus Sumerlaeota bacterium]